MKTLQALHLRLHGRLVMRQVINMNKAIYNSSELYSERNHYSVQF